MQQKINYFAKENKNEVKNNCYVVIHDIANRKFLGIIVIVQLTFKIRKVSDRYIVFPFPADFFPDIIKKVNTLKRSWEKRLLKPAKVKFPRN